MIQIVNQLSGFNRVEMKFTWLNNPQFSIFWPGGAFNLDAVGLELSLLVPTLKFVTNEKNPNESDLVIHIYYGCLKI